MSASFKSFQTVISHPIRHSGTILLTFLISISISIAYAGETNIASEEISLTVGFSDSPVKVKIRTPEILIASPSVWMTKDTPEIADILRHPTTQTGERRTNSYNTFEFPAYPGQPDVNCTDLPPQNAFQEPVESETPGEQLLNKETAARALLDKRKDIEEFIVQNTSIRGTIPILTKWVYEVCGPADRLTDPDWENAKKILEEYPEN